MPFTEKTKQQSQSIEDLIAQLDTPTAEATSASSAAGNATSESRKIPKSSKRTTSTSSNGSGSGGVAASPSNSLSSNQNHTSAQQFSRANSFGQEPVLNKNIIASKKYTKHMKSLKERGAMKKNGGGGKHNWGEPGCELEPDFMDEQDPNYDSDEEQGGRNVVMVCVENNDATSSKQPKEIDASSFETEIKLIVLEYFNNGDTFEVTDQLKGYKLTAELRAQFIVLLVQLALEKNSASRELTSRLLRDLNLQLFGEKEFVAGFDALLKNLSDLTLDNPDAPEKIGIFLARAVVDKVITQDYVENCVSSSDSSSEQARAAVEHARVLLKTSNRHISLSHIWGNHGGLLPVTELADQIRELIVEYHDSGDMDEAVRCVKDLDVPHFHHEIVYEALDFALQKGTDQAIELIVALLNQLCKSVIITYDQLKMGFTRIYDLLPDISLDVPNASALLDKILTQCHEKGFVSDDIIDMAPNRSRKRFVSEGDGGRIKQ